MSESRELSRAECLALLASGEVARVAVITPDGPHIVPVAYAVLEDTLVLRTSAYSLLGTHARDAEVALEIDEVDPGTRSGWSVVVRGRCAVEGDPRTIRAIREVAPDGPWADGTRTLHLRLPTDRVSGRAVAVPEALEPGACDARTGT